MSHVFIEQKKTGIDMNELDDGLELVYCSACGYPVCFAELHISNENFICYCATCVKEGKAQEIKGF